MLDKIREKATRTVVRVYCGDLGVNQAAEVGGLVGAAIAITGGLATFGDDIGETISGFFSDQFN